MHGSPSAWLYYSLFFLLFLTTARHMVSSNITLILLYYKKPPLLPLLQNTRGRSCRRSFVDYAGDDCTCKSHTLFCLDWHFNYSTKYYCSNTSTTHSIFVSVAFPLTRVSLKPAFVILTAASDLMVHPMSSPAEFI